MKTHNISTQSIPPEENNSFFVSDSIKHLVSEETFLKKQESLVDESLFATSDIITKISFAGKMFYADLIQFDAIESTIQIRSGIAGFKILYETDAVDVQILVKGELEVNKLKCQFQQFHENSRGDYIYSLRILKNIKEVLDAY